MSAERQIKIYGEFIIELLKDIREIAEELDSANARADIWYEKYKKLKEGIEEEQKIELK